MNPRRPGGEGGGASEPPRLLRHVLLLFPRAHRRAYEDEMWEVVRHRYGRGGVGRGARFRLHAETVVDLVGSALGMWMTMTRRTTMSWFGDRLGGFGLDVRFVARSLRRNPGYALTAVVVLAGAVAVNASVFGFVRGTLLAKATYPDPDGVVIIWGSNIVDGQLRDVTSGPNFIDMARETTSLDAMAAFHVDNAVLTGNDGRPEALSATSVSADFFHVIPVKPFLGRVFDERDRNSGAGETVLVSYAFWRDRLDADPSWIGRALPIDGEPHTVIGVLPEDFEPNVAICPLRLSNASVDDLEVEKIALRVAHLSLFGLEKQLWADETTIRYRGAEEGSDLRMSGKPPAEAAGAVLLTPPRIPVARGFRARTFARFINLPGFGTAS